jgi:hypothetical protein
MEIPMRGYLFGIFSAAMFVFSDPGLALEGGFDCAEGADEDLVTVESEPAQPVAPTGIPLS